MRFYRFIRAEKANYPVVMICRVGLTPSDGQWLLSGCDKVSQSLVVRVGADHAEG